MRPIIGRDYHASPTLRQMPRHWILEDSDRHRWQWWADPDVWVGLTCWLIALFAIAQALIN